MPKTLYLHIGHFKTGTTALQVFLSNQKKYLDRCGLEYPDLWRHHAKHSAYAFTILAAAGISDRLMHNFQGTVPTEDMWGDLYRHIRKSRSQGFIVSSEEFMRIGQFPAAQSILRSVLENRPSDLEVKALVYLRDPDSHLRSWYNQLVKMNIPVSDFNVAAKGEIEDIHIDYRRALEPWVDILGAENVMIRPYVKDPTDRDALHRDFMSALGHELPDGLVASDKDPNPRLDDRIIELVRLMQNMGFPSYTIDSIRTRAHAYLETQDALAPAGATRSSMEDVRDRSMAGLDWVDRQPGSIIPHEAFSASLPNSTSEERNASSVLVGFVLLELIRLRQRVNQANIPDLVSRIEALEKQLGMSGKGKGG